MAHPKLSLPWYQKVEAAVAPTEPATNMALAVLAIITILVLWKGSATIKAAWVVYLVSP